MKAGQQLVKLREFSTRLAERIREAPNQAAEPTRLGVRIGAGGYLLDMNQAGEIVAVPDLAPVPWTRSWFRGMGNVRGRLVGVIDLLQLSGKGILHNEQAPQMVVLGESLNSNAAILISRAFGLRNLKDLEPIGEVNDGLRPWEVMNFRDLDGNVLTELDLGRLVASEVFMTIGV